MKIALVTDAWAPQVNGVVTTLVELVREVQAAGHEVEVIHPGQFRTRPCPGYAGIDLAIRPGRELTRRIDELAPDAIHIATEGPLGWAARRYCLRRKLAFTTAFHTRFPEILHAALRLPLSWGYALFRHFHRPRPACWCPRKACSACCSGAAFAPCGPGRMAWTWTFFLTRNKSATTPSSPTCRDRWRCTWAGSPMRRTSRPSSAWSCRAARSSAAWARWKLSSRPAIPGSAGWASCRGMSWPEVYAAADVFVMSSRSETFGLVMLEAMACGTPVAAYPVDGPLEVLGQHEGRAQGGALDEDLRRACQRALAVPRREARRRAEAFSWAHASRQFLGHLAPARGGNPAARDRSVTQLSSRT
jgi:hypothetical protein